MSQVFEDLPIDALNNFTGMYRDVSASTNTTNTTNLTVTTTQPRCESAADSDMYTVDTSMCENVSFSTSGSPSSGISSSISTPVQASPNVPKRILLNPNARKRLSTTLQIEASRKPLAKVDDNSPADSDGSPSIDTSMFGVDPLEYLMSSDNQDRRELYITYEQVPRKQIPHFTSQVVHQSLLMDQLTNDSHDVFDDVFNDESNEYSLEAPIYQVDLGLGLSNLIRSVSKETQQTQQTQTHVQDFSLREIYPQTIVIDDLALIQVKSIGEIKHVLKMIVYKCDVGCIYYENNRETYIALRRLVCKIIKQSDHIYCKELHKILTDMLQSEITNICMIVDIVGIIVILSMILPPTETVVKFQSITYRLFHALHYNEDIFEYSVDTHRYADNNLLVYIQGASCKKYRNSLDSLSKFLEVIWNTSEKIDIGSIYQTIFQTDFI